MVCYFYFALSDAHCFDLPIIFHQHAIQLLQASEVRGGGLLKTKQLASKYQKELAAAKKDNDLIYSDIVPEISSLESPGLAAIAKVTEVPTSMSENFVG